MHPGPRKLRNSRRRRFSSLASRTFGSIEQLELRQLLAADALQLRMAPLLQQGLVEQVGDGLYRLTQEPLLLHGGPLMNANAADTTNADQLRSGGGLGLNLTGTGVTVGVWDGGAVRSTHQELTGRVSLFETGTTSDHATHVAGTIGAAGVVANARGMASGVSIRSHDYNFDISEMSGEAGILDLSNHSYGNLRGWTNRLDFGVGPIDTWVADRALFTEDPGFGKYTTSTSTIDSNLGVNLANPAALDSLLNSNQNLLSVWAAGNDRTDAFQNLYSSSTYITWRGDYGGGWYFTYDYNLPKPGPDGNSGFDTLPQSQVAKNSLVIGSIGDVTADPYSSSDVFVSNFSGWGPTDDGRIKPDLVANGESLYSSTNSSDTAYTTFSGTSMASPNATGSAALLIEHYKNVFGRKPLAATTKGLLIHTATDVGNTGPDYKTGWGVINAASAASLISSANIQAGSSLVAERTYLGTSQSYALVSDGTTPLKATIAWADIAGVGAGAALDDATSMLINNLDIQITGPDGTIYSPWTLDPANPNSPAVRTSANVRDNVEQVLIDTPSAGTYTITIGGTVQSTQNFSLIVSGVNSATNGAPSVAIQNATTELAEAVINTNFKVADVIVSDDLLGSVTYSLTGSDAALFNLVNNALVIRAGTVLDYETNPVLDVTINVDDPSISGSPDASVSLQIAVLDRPELVITAPSYTGDTTPSITVTVTDPGAGMPDGTILLLDVDRNGDGDFNDSGETASVTTTLVGGTATFDITPELTNGRKSLRARALDAASVEAVSATKLLDIDLTGPTISVSISSTTRDTTPNLSYSAFDSLSGMPASSETFVDIDLNNDGDFLDVGEVAYKTVFLTSTSTSIEITPALASGSYKVRARARDRVGNEGVSNVRSFVIDASPPVVTLTAPAFTNSTTPQVSVLTTDSQSSVSSLIWIDLDKNNDGDFIDSGESNFDLESLTNATGSFSLPTISTAGTYRMRARVSDSPGNEGISNVVTMVLDFTAPTGSLFVQSWTNDRTPAVTVTATDALSGIADGAPVLIDVDLNNDSDFTDAGETAHSQGLISAGTVTIELAGPLADRSYRVRARVSDRAGNQATLGPALFGVESVAPQVLVVAPTFTNDLTPSLTIGGFDFQSGLPASSTGHLDIDLNNDGDFSDPGELAYQVIALNAGYASFDVSSPLPEGFYRMRGRLSDVAGNEGISNLVTMIIDKTSPTVTLTAPASTLDSTPGITITASDAGSGIPQQTTATLTIYPYGDGDIVGTMSVPLVGGTATFDISPPLPPGIYRLAGTVLDWAGNQGLLLQELIVEDPTVILTLSAPTYNNDGSPTVELDATNGYQMPDGTIVSLDFDANRDGDFDDTGETSYLVGSLTSGHVTLQLEDLVLPGQYAMQASVVGAFGVTYVSDVLNVIVDFEGPRVSLLVPSITNDNTPQLIVGALDVNLMGEVRSGFDPSPTVFLDIDRNNDGDFADADELGFIGTLFPPDANSNNYEFYSSYDLPLPLTDGAYRFRVRMSDRAGNVSFSDVPTLVVDTTAPSVSLSVASNTTDSTPSVTVQVTDLQLASPAAPVAIDLDRNGDGDFLDSGELDFTSIAITGGSATFDLQLPSADGLYHVRARTSDMAGNPGTSAVASLRLDTTPPEANITGPEITGTAHPDFTVSFSDAGVGMAPTSLLAVDIDLNSDGDFLDVDELNAMAVELIAGFAQFSVEPALSEGTHALRFRATDAVGNEYVAARSTIVDLTPPTVTLVAPGSTIDLTPSVTVTATDNFGFGPSSKVYIDLDLNRDGDYSDPGEFARTEASFSGGSATFDIVPALPRDTFTLRARVEDGAGLVGTSLERTILVGNLLPSAPTISPSTFQENSTASASGFPQMFLSASDSLGTIVGYELVSGDGDDDNALFSISGNRLVPVPDASVNYEVKSSYHVRVAVIDNDGGQTTAALVLTVTDANDAPVFTSPLVQLATPGLEYRFDLNAIDEDGDAIVITAPELPGWLTFVQTGPNTARVSGTPATSDLGYSPVRLVADDGTDTNDLTYGIYVQNSAPVLPTDTINLGSVAGETTYPDGFSILPLVANVTDAPGAPRGIAVIGTSGDGVWQYSQYAIPWWSDFGNISPSRVRLLKADATTLVRFVPSPNFTGTASLVFRAWDQAYGGINEQWNLSSPNDVGGTTAFSAEVATATINVTPVNRAPVISPSGNILQLPNMNEDDTNSAGVLVSALDTISSDPDAGALKGIAVTAAANPNGIWQFTLDGTAWNDFGTVSLSSARLLAADATTRVRFVPNPDYTGHVSFTFRAWDQTQGTAGSTFNITKFGGTTSFSSYFGLVDLAVKPVNDAPVLTAPASVSTLPNTAITFTGANAISFTDVDAGSAMNMNIATTGGSSTLSTMSGVTILNGANGTALFTVRGTLANLNAALNNLKFTPTANYSGAASIKVSVNDQGNTGSGGPISVNRTIAISVSYPTVIVDNGQPGYAEESGTWFDSGLKGVNNSSSRFSSFASAAATWTPTLPAGFYTISIFKLANQASSSNAQLSIVHNGATDVQTIDLRATTAGFVEIPGVFYFSGSGSELVRLAQGSLVNNLRADAIRFVKVPAPTLTIDNGQAGYDEAGIWTTSGLLGSNGSSTRFSAAANATATWTPSDAGGLTAGTYRIEFYKIVHPVSSTNAQLMIKASGVTTTQSIDLTTGTSGYVDLGVFTFNGSPDEWIRLSQGAPNGTLRADVVRLTRVS